jgi:hypothetical protein
MAAELKGRTIRVNTLSPGAIDTPIIDSQFKTKEEADGGREMFKQMTPLGRIGKPEEMAKAILFLASDDSSYTTGADLVADGGITSSDAWASARPILAWSVAPAARSHTRQAQQKRAARKPSPRVDVLLCGGLTCGHTGFPVARKKKRAAFPRVQRRRSRSSMSRNSPVLGVNATWRRSSDSNPLSHTTP